MIVDSNTFDYIEATLEAQLGITKTVSTGDILALEPEEITFGYVQTYACRDSDAKWLIFSKAQIPADKLNAYGVAVFDSIILEPVIAKQYGVKGPVQIDGTTFKPFWESLGNAPVRDLELDPVVRFM